MIASDLLDAVVGSGVRMFVETSGLKITCVASVDDTLVRPVCSYVIWRRISGFMK